MVDISSQNNKINVTVSSSGNTANTKVTPDYAQYYSEKSKEWAISDKLIDNEDYSSKYYANESKKQANIATAKTTEVIASGNNAVTNIESARDNAIIDITNQENLSVDNVNTAGATQVSSVNTAGITQVANVNSAGTTQINLAKEQVTLATNQANIATEQATIATNKTSEVVASGNEALSNIDTAKTGAITDITDLKNTSVSNITTAKNSAISTITTQETTSKNNVIATGNAQVERVNLTGVDNRTPIFSKSEIGTNESVYQNIYDLKHSTFDKSKFTVVGSPTITDDGVASGFTKDNYINTDYVWTPSNNIWEIRIKCKTPSTLPSPYPAMLMGSIKGDCKVPRIGLHENGKWVWSIPNDTGTKWQKEYWGTLHSANLNTDYYFKMYFTGTEYKLDYSLDNKTWNNMATYQSTIPVYNLGSPIGLGGDLISLPWTGSIDLKQFSITVDGKEVFSGNKTGLDVIKPDNYEVVGSPVISDDGMFTSTSTADSYIKKEIPEIINSNNYTIKFTIKDYDINSIPVGYYQCAFSDLNGTARNGFDFNIIRGTSSIQIVSNRSVMGVITIGYISFQEIGDIYVEIKIKGNIANYHIMRGKTTLQKDIDISGINSWSGNFVIGNRTNDLRMFYGSIDLNSFKIYVDDQLVYQPCLKIPYTLSKTGSKIVDVAYRDRVIDLYEQEGQAGYYTIDEENQNFTLPMGEVYGMIEKKASKKEDYNKITNCLLEVPQRIKLELNDGILTLKAGSQVIVPNGFEADGTTPKFDYVVIPNDKNTTNFWDDVRFVAHNPNIGLEPMPISSSFSGATQPSTNQYAFWYDTTNNLVKSTNDNGATWLTGLSLPICTAYGTNGTTVTRINQVFNGMGYIGSTVWVDKGVKGLAPNGRNADGTLNSVEWEIDKIKTFTDTSTHTNAINFCYNAGSQSFQVMSPKNWSFDEDANIWKHVTAGDQIVTKLGSYTGTGNASGSVANFNSNKPFRAVDYNDKSEISGWSMPSNKYIDLTLGATGSTYTAPANGWFVIDKKTGINGFAYLVLRNTTSMICNNPGVYNNSQATLSAFVPAKKGDNIVVSYNATGNTELFRFIYAEGEV